MPWRYRRYRYWRTHSWLDNLSPWQILGGTLLFFLFLPHLIIFSIMALTVIIRLLLNPGCVILLILLATGALFIKK